MSDKRRRPEKGKIAEPETTKKVVEPVDSKPRKRLVTRDSIQPRKREKSPEEVAVKRSDERRGGEHKRNTRGERSEYSRTLRGSEATSSENRYPPGRFPRRHDVDRTSRFRTDDSSGARNFGLRAQFFPSLTGEKVETKAPTMSGYATAITVGRTKTDVIKDGIPKGCIAVKKILRVRPRIVMYNEWKKIFDRRLEGYTDDFPSYIPEELMDHFLLYALGMGGVTFYDHVSDAISELEWTGDDTTSSVVSDKEDDFSDGGDLSDVQEENEVLSE